MKFVSSIKEDIVTVGDPSEKVPHHILKVEESPIKEHDSALVGNTI